jgi:hypothetical protein
VVIVILHAHPEFDGITGPILTQDSFFRGFKGGCVFKGKRLWIHTYPKLLDGDFLELFRHILSLRLAGCSSFGLFGYCLMTWEMRIPQNSPGRSDFRRAS